MHYLFRFCCNLFNKTESVTSINGQDALVLLLLVCWKESPKFVLHNEH
jgi:hypothetical protein